MSYHDLPRGPAHVFYDQLAPLMADGGAVEGDATSFADSAVQARMNLNNGGIENQMEEVTADRTITPWRT